METNIIKGRPLPHRTETIVVWGIILFVGGIPLATFYFTLWLMIQLSWVIVLIWSMARDRRDWELHEESVKPILGLTMIGHADVEWLRDNIDCIIHEYRAHSYSEYYVEFCDEGDELLFMIRS